MRALAADSERSLRERWRASPRPAAYAVAGRRAHRRHLDVGARPAGQAPPDAARHHAGEPLADAAARGRARTLRRACRPSSSTNGTSSSATSAACRPSSRWRGCGAGAPTRRSGACRRRSAISTTRERALLGPRRRRDGVAGRRPARQTRSSSTRCCPRRPSASPGAAISAPPWRAPVVAEIDAHAHDAGLHQRALAGRDLVSSTAEAPARLGRASSPLHHGSLTRETRDFVERGLKEGR